MVLRWGKGVSRRDARHKALEMLDLLGLGKKRICGRCSCPAAKSSAWPLGGLIKEPTFVFADEPTSALDWKHGEQVVELLRAAAHDRGATILVVAHDSRLIAHADRVFHLEDGNLAESFQESHPHEKNGTHPQPFSLCRRP